MLDSTLLSASCALRGLLGNQTKKGCISAQHNQAVNMRPVRQRSSPPNAQEITCCLMVTLKLPLEDRVVQILARFIRGIAAVPFSAVFGSSSGLLRGSSQALARIQSSELFTWMCDLRAESWLYPGLILPSSLRAFQHMYKHS